MPIFGPAANSIGEPSGPAAILLPRQRLAGNLVRADFERPEIGVNDSILPGYPEAERRPPACHGRVLSFTDEPHAPQARRQNSELLNGIRPATLHAGRIVRCQYARA